LPRRSFSPPAAGGKTAPFVAPARFCAMPSTVIKRFDYRPEARELLVTFTTGRRYLYSDVPDEAVDEFRSAFSKGRHFNAHIRDCYRFRELEPENADLP
jgi:hypothetical protein